MYHQPSIPPATATYHHQPMGVHGNILQVTVVGCTKLKDTEWISRQDPYVCLEYGNTRYRTRVCTDGGKNPTFQEKFVYSAIEGLREFNIVVWNSNTISHDDFIGSGKVHLAKVLSQGHDDSSWPLQTKHGRHAGEVRLIMHYSSANANSYVPSAPSYVTPTAQQVSMYAAPPPPSTMLYPPAATGAYPMPPTYPPQPVHYPLDQIYPPNSVYPPQPVSYLPVQTYPPSTVYPPQPYGLQYSHGSSYPGGYHTY